jgi:NDP-sugar pyrophosphorylase family protein
MLELTAEKLVRAGFDDLIVNIHHHPEQMLEEIEKTAAAGDIPDYRQLTKVTELLDTAGGLYRARGFFGSRAFPCTQCG